MEKGGGGMGRNWELKSLGESKAKKSKPVPKREGEVGKEKEGEGGGEKGRNDDFKAENISKHFRIIDTS